MKYPQLLLITLLTLILGTTLQARQLTIQAAPDHSGYTAQQFPLDDGLLEIDRGYYTVGETEVFNPEAWSISFSGNKVSFIENRDGAVYLSNLTPTGRKSAEENLEFFNAQDETMKVYAFDDGRTVTRDNVANFTFFDPAGEVLFSQSNSSQSSDGERESQLAADAFGQTIVLYNPVISYGSTRGSQARVIFNEEESNRFFNSQSSEIKNLSVSKNGSFITILTSDNTLFLFDRFGNELNQISFDDDQIGVSLTDDAEYVTVFSSSRAQVIDALSGERLGSTSSRSPVVYASYIPEDDTILILGGAVQGNQINDPMMTAVNISQRQIDREEISMPLAVHDMQKVRISRERASHYRLDGLNRSLIITASF
ncbi:hypothetical protein [Rhodohalobacter halophilus]|uniref:hypothetical protein n=1 Tax=Rhodohalobacter halophilus TaxID=1812810 RepID=UPI00114CBAFA|nr:hypothetical protein [Rhodohalobacter halophilus]